MPAANQTRPRPEAWRRVTPPSPHGSTDRDRAPGRLPLRQPQSSPPCCWVPREPKGCAEPAGPWHSAWAGLQGHWSLRLLPGRQGRPPGPAVPCAPFPAQLACWQLGAPPSQGGASPRDEGASLGSQRLRGRPGAPWPPGWEALQPDLGECGLKGARVTAGGKPGVLNLWKGKGSPLPGPTVLGLEGCAAGRGLPGETQPPPPPPINTLARQTLVCGPGARPGGPRGRVPRGRESLSAAKRHTGTPYCDCRPREPEGQAALASEAGRGSRSPPSSSRFL